MKNSVDVTFEYTQLSKEDFAHEIKFRKIWKRYLQESKDIYLKSCYIRSFNRSVSHEEDVKRMVHDPTARRKRKKNIGIDSAPKYIKS